MRLDADDAKADDDGSLPEDSQTRRLLEGLAPIDTSCFPRDTTGLSGINSLLHLKRLRRATRVAVRWVEAPKKQDELVYRHGGAGFTETSGNIIERIPVAFVLFTAGSMCFEITKVAVSAAHRRKGYARAMFVEGVFAFAKLKGVKTIRLRVETSNTGAIGLYRNLGFAQDRNRGIKNCYGPGRDAAVFEYTVG